MATSTIEDIEKKIKQLPRSEQLCLFERLVGSPGSDLHISITGCRRTLSSCKWGYARPKIMSNAKNIEIVVLKNN